MSASATPLSDAISRLVADDTPESFSAFLSVFRRSVVGTVAASVPANRKPGETFVAREGEVKLAILKAPNGQKMVQACADPEVFAVRVADSRINALMTGEEMLKMLLKVPDIAGILACSAASFHSVPITHADAEAALATKPSESPSEGAGKSWWKFWER